MTDTKYKRVYLTPKSYAALVSFCETYGLKQYAFLSIAIDEAITRRNIARRWDEEAGKFINYTVEYPGGEPAGDTETP